jgi:hypothetical protein
MARVALLSALLLLGAVAPRAHFSATAQAGAPAPAPSPASASMPIMRTGSAFVAVCAPARGACAAWRAA